MGFCRYYFELKLLTAQVASFVKDLDHAPELWVIDFEVL